MPALTLIFPHQLFPVLQHPALNKERPVWLVEDYLYFRHLDFHIQKIILHRATMQLYAASLRVHGYTVHYVESHDLPARTSLGAHLHKAHVREIHLVDPVDTWLERDLDAACTKSKEYTIEKVVYDSPMFLTSRADIHTVLGTKKRPFMKTFYEWQRNRLDILMEEKGGKNVPKVPIGGVYSFDTENRKKLPKGYVPPTIKPLHRSKESAAALAEASSYAHTHFPHAYGIKEYVGGAFSYALTRTEALAVLHDFVEHRLADFGPYEDAISTEHAVIAHSVLSPYLNIGPT
jgi:deoxyribodipyrimidine photolyase-related protein